MHIKPLPLILAVLILLVAGIALWFVLSRPVTIVPGGTATSTPSGIPEVTKEHIKEDATYYEIDAAYPTWTPLTLSAGAEANTEAVTAMKFFVEKEIARFKDNGSFDTLTEEDIQIQGLGGERKYALGLEYEVRSSPFTLSYIYFMYEDTLGAHPNAYYRTFTFDTETGEEVHLDELFTSEAYLPILSEKSRVSLRETLGPDAASDMLEAGTTPFPDNFQNFYLDGAEFVIIFAPYQVGPWAIGTQEVRIPKTSLTSVLQAKYR